MGLLTGTENSEEFERSLFHRCFRGRRSGNEINGLGEKRRRRPTPIYHDRRSLHPCVALRGFWKYVRQARAIDRERPSPIARPRSEDSPERWSARCVPYFNDKFGCGIWLAVCPWSRPGVAEKLTAKMAERRDRHAAWSDEPSPS